MSIKISINLYKIIVHFVRYTETILFFKLMHFIHNYQLFCHGFTEVLANTTGRIHRYDSRKTQSLELYILKMCNVGYNLNLDYTLSTARRSRNDRVLCRLVHENIKNVKLIFDKLKNF